MSGIFGSPRSEEYLNYLDQKMPMVNCYSDDYIEKGITRNIKEYNINKIAEYIKRQNENDIDYSNLVQKIYKIGLLEQKTDAILSVVSPIYLSLSSLVFIYIFGANYVKTDNVRHKETFHILCYVTASILLLIYISDSLLWSVSHDEKIVDSISRFLILFYYWFIYKILQRTNNLGFWGFNIFTAITVAPTLYVYVVASTFSKLYLDIYYPILESYI